jgi:hypothetical protein
VPDEPAGKITNDKPGTHQNEAEVTTPIPISRGEQNSDQNPPNTNHRSYKPKHDCFDWVNLVVLVLTFLAAGGAAFEAKRLADGTDQLMRDAQNAFEVGSRAWISLSHRCWLGRGPGTRRTNRDWPSIITSGKLRRLISTKDSCFLHPQTQQ